MVEQIRYRPLLCCRGTLDTNALGWIGWRTAEPQSVNCTASSDIGPNISFAVARWFQKSQTEAKCRGSRSISVQFVKHAFHTYESSQFCCANFTVIRYRNLGLGERRTFGQRAPADPSNHRWGSFVWTAAISRPHLTDIPSAASRTTTACAEHGPNKWPGSNAEPLIVQGYACCWGCTGDFVKAKS
jgi:hypothetical protein